MRYGSFFMPDGKAHEEGKVLCYLVMSVVTDLTDLTEDEILNGKRTMEVSMPDGWRSGS